MLELTSQRWAKLSAGRGDARWVPSLIESIHQRGTAEQISDFVVDLSDLCHDWSTYDVTYAECHGRVVSGMALAAGV